MTLLVIFSFVAMVLAPCVVALWGRLREGAEDQEVVAPAEVMEQDGAQHQESTGVFSTMFATDGPLARSVRKVGRALHDQSTRQSDSKRLDLRPADPAKVTSDAGAEPLPQIAVATTVPAAVPVPLEELLREALEGARMARAASLRADAAASGAAARIATVRAEAAAEQARLAHVDAMASDQAALAAHEAYEAARAQAEQPDGPRQAIRLVSDRRAA